MTLNLFIPITKVDAAKRLVYGVLTQEVTDKSGEIYDYESGKQAFITWSDEAFKASGGKSKGNLRAMHDSIAAGKFTDITFDDVNKRVEGCAKVVDDAEWEKVLEGVYTGFSIGGGYAKRWQDKDNPALYRFTPTLAEVSLVDNPCVPTATFEVIKQDGSTELRKFHHHNQEDSMTKATETEGGAAAADVEKTDLQKAAEEKEAALKEAAKEGEQVWKSSISGELFASKAEMAAHNVEQRAVAKASGAFDALKSINASLDKAESGEPTPAPAPTPEPSPAPAPEPVPEPAAVDKAQGGELKKGLYGIGYLAEILASIEAFQSSTEFEAMFEGDDSAMPETIKGWLKQGVEILKAYVEEETSELFDGDDVEVEVLAMAAKMSGESCDALAKFVKSDTARDALGKAGSRHSKADKASLMAIHKSATDHVASIEKCFKDTGIMDAQKSHSDDSNTELLKAELSSERLEKAALEKVIGDLNSQFGDLAKRLEHIESQPAPAKGVLKAVAKTQDAGGTGDGKPSPESVKKALDALPMDQRAQLLMKAALASPVVLAE